MTKDILYVDGASEDTPVKGYVKVNEYWAVDADDSLIDLKDLSCIESDRLNENDWILHQLEKGPENLGYFVEAYFYACKRSKIKTIPMLTHY